MVSISELNASAYSYHSAIAAEFQEICRPLLNLGIKCFSYIRIFNDGSYMVLVNHEKYIKKYLSIIDTNGSIFTNNIHTAFTFDKHYYILDQDINIFDKNKDPIMHLLYDYDIWNLCTIYKKRDLNSIEGYTFAMSRAEEYATHFYANHFYLLEHFIQYFNQRAKDLIDCNDKKRLAYFKQEFSFNQQCPYQSLAHNIENFLRETRFNGLTIKGQDTNICLTARETECLKYLALGKSIKEIARTLGLSPRTIEYYIQNTKNKTGLKSRGELLMRYYKTKII
jgi:DNA-binding CsgD family transcriptional regulator